MRYDASGMGEARLHPWRDRLDDARVNILALHKRGEQGWLDLPTDKKMTARIAKAVASVKHAETLLVLGIGGSDLGARAILQALPQKRRVLFAGGNTDPDELSAIFSQIDWKHAAVNIISKSGDTVEPMSAFFVARERLKKAIGKSFAERIVATTDAAQGSLAALAKKEGYARLIVPENVGGRFSVLSDVGLFPAAWAGVPVARLLAGAAREAQAFRHKAAEEQIAAVYAARHAGSYRDGRTVFVLMPYAARLQSFAFWYRQLIAESLGKRLNREGGEVHAGPTPVAALGATDQHSQLQLYMEGPEDKVVTFIEIEKFAADVRVPKPPMSSDAFRGLAGRSFQDLIHAERRFTAEALASVERPSGTLFLQRLDAEHLGALFQMFMHAIAYLGELLNVDAYNQPGVEEGKRRFRAWLSH